MFLTGTNSEKNAERIMIYFKKSKGVFFKNNPSTRKKLNLSFGEINGAVRILKRVGILEKYTRGSCYKINRNIIEKLKK